MSSDKSSLAIRADGLGKAYKLGEQSTLMSMGRSAPRRLHWALDNISFDIHHGEAVGIIGHNGAGKSTLLKLLARITEPTRGASHHLRPRGLVARSRDRFSPRTHGP